MGELGRIFTNKKIIGFLILLFTINIFFLLKDQMGSRSYDYTRETKRKFAELQNEYKDRDYQELYEELTVITKKSEVYNILTAIDSYDSATGAPQLTEYYDQMKNQYAKDYPDLVEEYYENPKLYANEEQRITGAVISKIHSQLSYILKDYPKKLEDIHNQAVQMSTISIFSKPNSFSKGNIEKTDKEYAAMMTKPLTIGSDEAFTMFVQFKVTDYLLLGLMVCVIIQFLSERKKGLWNIIYATKRGRFWLAFQRSGVIILVAFASAFLFYGCNLLIGLILYGGTSDFGRMLQSIPTFQNNPYPVTIGGFVLQFIMLKGLAFALIGVASWLAVSAFQNMSFSILAMAMLLVVQYASYTYISILSKFNLLKYINLFSFIDVGNKYTYYLNLNLFSHPIGIRAVASITLPVILVVCLVITYVINAKKRPVQAPSVLAKQFDRLLAILSKRSGHVSLFRFEGYKLFWVQKGIFLLLILLYLAWNAKTNHQIFYSNEMSIRNEYYDDAGGPITEKTMEFFNQEQSQVDVQMAMILDATARYLADEMSYEEYYPITYQREQISYRIAALEYMKTQIARLNEIKETRGIDVWLVNPLGYETLIGNASATGQRKDVLTIILFITLMVGSSIAYEKQMKAFALVRAIAKGRQPVIGLKMLWAFIVTLCVALPIYYTAIMNVKNSVGLPYLKAPVQSIGILEEFPIVMSIGEFMIMVYALRVLLMYCMALLALLVSSYTKASSEGIIAAVAVTTIPAALEYVGFRQIAYVSLLKPAGVMEIWLDKGYQGILWLLPMLLILAIGISAALLSRKRWISAARRGV
ncbi:MAG: hypothetical protein K0S76_2316 [Herbinix sp.]|jgi:hypothetical protein|nr:hypothetical protein [Herbinix sp.]